MKRFLLILLILGAGAAAYVHYFGVPPQLARLVETATPGEATPATGGGRGGGGGRGRRGGGGGDGPVAVLAAPARFADVPVTLDAVGTVQALNTVTVRAQVDGKLMKIAFRDGQDVEAGDVLAMIDPTTYQASYDQAVAKKAQDEAQLANARIDLARYQKLAQTEFGSRQQADTQRAVVAQLEAQVRSDQAAIDNAKAVLDYTTIRAPLSGRTGIRQVDQGNIIHAADANGLVVITQLKPISVFFNVPQQQLRMVSGAMAGGTVSLKALEADGVRVLDEGVVEVIDNQVDPTTGTVKLKARFPNDHLQLWPGQFVNVRLLVDTLRHVVVVPTSAVQRGPTGPFTFVIDTQSKVHLRPVTVGRQDELLAVITAGVAPPETVVTTGFTRLTDGAAVSVTLTPDGTAPAESAPPPAASRDDVRQRRRQGEGRGQGREQGQGQRQGQRQGEGRSAEPPRAGETPAAAAPRTDGDDTVRAENDRAPKPGATP